jgi:ATP-dependent protease ClpP protease subunit
MKDTIDFFKKLSDKDFYSNKLTHLYITGTIDSKNIEKLIEDVRNANKETNPKPILIHISSMGGDLKDGIKLLSIYNISSVPIATIIDNYCFSIATLLLINSNYRLMNKNAFCLLHEYSINGYINNNKHNILNFINTINSYFKSIIDIYLKKTAFSKEELHDLLEHNLLLDYKFCLKKRIVDRIIDYEYKSPELSSANITDILKDVNINNLNINCKMTNEEIDNSINKINSNNSTIIYTTYSNCYSDDDNNDDKKEKPNDDTKIFILLYNSLNLISKIKAINTYKYGIIDVPISIEYLIPLLYTNKIIMYSHTYIICNLLHSFQNYSLLLDDNIKNTKMIINKIKDILKQKTKIPKDYIDNIDKKFSIIDAKKAKEFGLCSYIIDT